MNIDKPNFDRNDIERIISSALSEYDKNDDIGFYSHGNTFVIIAHQNDIDAIRNKIASIPQLENVVIIEPHDIKKSLPDVALAQEIPEHIIKVINQDIEMIPRFIDNIITPPKRHYVETKSKQVNNIQKKLQDGYSRAQFNQRKHMHNIIRIKHK